MRQRDNKYTALKSIRQTPSPLAHTKFIYFVDSILNQILSLSKIIYTIIAKNKVIKHRNPFIASNDKSFSSLLTDSTNRRKKALNLINSILSAKNLSTYLFTLYTPSVVGGTVGGSDYYLSRHLELIDGFGPFRGSHP